MKIGLDGILLRGDEAGTLRYFQLLVAGLASVDSENEYFVFAASALSQFIPNQGNFSLQSVRPPRGLPRILFQQIYSDWFAAGRLDVIHSPAFSPPLRVDCPRVMTLLDLAFLLYPETKKWTGLLWSRLFWKRGVTVSNCVIVMSASLKRELLARVPSARVRVIYPATQSTFRPLSHPRAFLSRYHVPESYILHVGTLEPRKNIPNLLRAYAQARKQGARDYALVLAGAHGWGVQEIFKTVEDLGLGREVIFLSHVPDQDLPALYSGAALFVYLSRYEGFGFPVLEAMACGTPVLTSNVSSLPEVAGDAGVLVAPDEFERAASEMVRILYDAELRRAMCARGLNRARFFSLERFARATLDVYNQAERDSHSSANRI